RLTGNGGSNVIYGSDYGDAFIVSAGTDELYGGGGNDSFTILSAATYSGFSGFVLNSTSIDGSDGFDVMVVNIASGTVVLNPNTYVEMVTIQGPGAVNVDASNVFNDAGIVMIG